MAFFGDVKGFCAIILSAFEFGAPGTSSRGHDLDRNGTIASLPGERVFLAFTSNLQEGQWLLACENCVVVRV